MGFDNECIPNIQSLSGEYFCPVCRLLVYPNEALQSQCTHLYCKPCLTYVVSTTRACPYDGYLVTEADSKPLSESNKGLAETIGKINVHCLYHRSGCPWQGPLSECTSHCSGCAFGNSPVVCNRCGIQIVHSQVQEHAQNCPGVQPQTQPAEGAQDATSTGAPTTGDQAQAAIQTGTITPQAQTSVTSTPGKDTTQQINAATQAQTAVQAAVPTAEQWYQQQYQQYYQQYPGYDPYQQQYQQYYPYQQQAVSQYQQPQASMHAQVPQPMLQTLPQPQVPIAAQPQNQAQLNPQQQTHLTVQQQSLTQLQAHPPAHGYPPPQAQSNPQPHPVQPLPQHVPQYQHPQLQVQHSQPQIQAQTNSQLHPQQHPIPQPHVQAQPQTLQPLPQSLASQPNQTANPNLQTQPQHSSVYAVTGHHSYQQPQVHQQMQTGASQHSQGGPQLQSQQPVQMQSQFPQQSPLLPPSQYHAAVQNLQQPGLLPSPGQVPNIPPAPQQLVHSHAHQPGLPVQQRPGMQPIPQPMHQQYAQHQQPFSGQPWGAVHNQVHQQGPYVQQQLHPQTQVRPQGLLQSLQQPSHVYPHPQQNVLLPHGAHPHQAKSLAAGPGLPAQLYPDPASSMQVRSIQIGANQQSGNIFKTNNQVELSFDQQSGVASRQRQGDIVKGAEGDLSAQKTIKKELNDLDAGLAADASEIKTIKSESNLKQEDDKNKPTGEAKDVPESLAAANGESSIKQVKEEHGDGADEQKYVSNADHENVELSVSEHRDGPQLEIAPSQLEEQSMKLQKDKTPTSQSFGGFPPNGHVQSQSVSVVDQGKLEPLPIHHGPSALQQRPVGPSLVQASHLGPPHQMQLPGHPPTQPGRLGPGHVPSHYGPPQGAYPHAPTPQSQGERTPAHVHEATMFANQRPKYPDGRPGTNSNVVGMNGAQGPNSDRFRSFPDEHLNRFPHGPTHHNVHQGEFEEDLKHFPRPSHLDTEPVPKSSSHFPSSRPLDRGRHGFGMDGAPKPLGKGSHGFNYDSGLNMEPLGGSAPPRFFPPYHHDKALHPSDAEGSLGFHDSLAGRSDFGRTRPGFLGPPIPGYDHRHLDNFAPRSPVRDYPGMPARRFGAPPGLDEIDGRDPYRFGDTASSSLHDSRFPVFPSHLRRGELEGPGNLHMGEHLSGDLMGHDGRPGHLRRGEHLGPRNLPSHLWLGEPGNFGAFPGNARMGELPGPGNFYHHRVGEPGFRSSFGGNYAGDLQFFDNSRKRKPSMGWCRICKVDCETVEGLDLHSQTREHQNMALDMVVTIKQNAKKHKSTSSDHSSLEDKSKSRNASFDGRGNKH
uniref:RING-type domain-containing protein n=2 Tax=Salix viminalis TaxID=40686 RepID=A0A6N2LHT8_SALVM